MENNVIREHERRELILEIHRQTTPRWGAGDVRGAFIVRGLEGDILIVRAGPGPRLGAGRVLASRQEYSEGCGPSDRTSGPPSFFGVTLKRRGRESASDRGTAPPSSDCSRERHQVADLSVNVALHPAVLIRDILM